MSELSTTTDPRADLIRRTLCQGASDDELALFLAQAQRLGLDPLSGQIHAVRRWDSRAKREVMRIQVGIDGLRAIAQRTGEMDGYDTHQWCGPDGVWQDVWLSPDPPVAARVTVYRRGHSRGYPAVALYAEYCPRDKDGRPAPMWVRMPALMLAKCAESLALRRAFPAELSGVYEPAELDGADTVPASTAPNTPTPTAPAPAQSMITPAQMRRLHALCNDLGLGRDQRLSGVILLKRRIAGDYRYPRPATR